MKDHNYRLTRGRDEENPDDEFKEIKSILQSLSETFPHFSKTFRKVRNMLITVSLLQERTKLE